MNLWMVYTCNMKSSESTYERWRKKECTSHRRPKSCGCTRPYKEFERHLVDSGIQHRKWGGNTYPEKRKLLFEIKKKKVKI